MGPSSRFKLASSCLSQEESTDRADQAAGRNMLLVALSCSKPCAPLPE